MTEADLLAAAAANPDDDAPRLAYADWCDAHGRPARAEFIRLQCAGADALPGYYPEARREHELLFAHWDEWTADLRALGMTTRVHYMPDDGYALLAQFGRGFVEHLTLTAEHFALLAPRFFVAAPLVRSLALRNTLGALRDRAAGHLPTGNGFQNPAELMLALNEVSRDGWYLRHLDLSTFGLTATAFGAIQTYRPLLSGLTYLELWNNPLGDDGVRVFLERSLLPDLRELHLGGCGITDAGAAALASDEFLGGRLTRLSLHGNEFTAAGEELLRERFGDRVEL